MRHFRFQGVFRARRNLPMVLVDQPYVFHTPDGERRLLDLFEGRLQLAVYHFMWLWEDGQAAGARLPQPLGLRG